MLYSKKISTPNAIIVLLMVILLTACIQSPLETAQKLIAEKEYDLSIEQYNKFIKNNPQSLSLIADTCLYEGIKLLKKSNYRGADKLYKYAISLIQLKSLDFPKNLFTYLKVINNHDSIMNLVIKLTPQFSNKKLSLLLTKLSSIDSKIYPGYCLKIKDGYSSNSWIFPSNSSHKENKKLFGISTFNPKTSYILSNTELSQIESQSTTLFITGIRNNKMYINESYKSNGLIYSNTSELSDIFYRLSKMDDLQIASEKEKVIKEIIKLREKYLVANLKYIFTKFEITGKCFAYKNNYNVDTQEIDLHISINDGSDGIYIATIRVPLSLADAQDFFKSSDGYYTSIKYIVTPGISRKRLGIAGGGFSRWVMPNLNVLKEIKIYFKNSEGTIFKFETIGLKGVLWNYDVNTERWDLNDDIDNPHGELRIINGKKL